jgi:hypothetical protein
MDALPSSIGFSIASRPAAALSGKAAGAASTVCKARAFAAGLLVPSGVCAVFGVLFFP